MRVWKVYCEDHKYPGLWQRWYRNQCAAVGWPSSRGFSLEGRAGKTGGWLTTRKHLGEMQIGDIILVTLSDNRIARLGEITQLSVGDDQWEPTVPKSGLNPIGEKGRRIELRWELTTGPDDPDTVVVLPEALRFRGNVLRWTTAEIKTPSISQIRSAMDAPENWVSISGTFAYERALSDYIGRFPSQLEDGLQGHTELKLREKVFGDKTRSDVLLIDRKNRTVVVECKQGAPTMDDIKQLKNYMRLVDEITESKSRGILVHGGASRVDARVMALTKSKPKVSVVNYRLSVTFQDSTTAESDN